MSESDFPIPFGQYKGIPITKVPREYLRWLITNIPVYGRLKVAIEFVLEGKAISPEGSKARLNEIAITIDDIIKPWSPDQGEIEVYK